MNNFKLLNMENCIKMKKLKYFFRYQVKARYSTKTSNQLPKVSKQPTNSQQILKMQNSYETFDYVAALRGIARRLDFVVSDARQVIEDPRTRMPWPRPWNIVTLASILGGSGIWMLYLVRSTPTRMPSSMSVGATLSPSATTKSSVPPAARARKGASAQPAFPPTQSRTLPIVRPRLDDLRRRFEGEGGVRGGGARAGAPFSGEGCAEGEMGPGVPGP